MRSLVWTGIWFFGWVMSNKKLYHIIRASPKFLDVQCSLFRLLLSNKYEFKNIWRICSMRPIFDRCYLNFFQRNYQIFFKCIEILRKVCYILSNTREMGNTKDIYLNSYSIQSRHRIYSSTDQSSYACTHITL